MPWEFAPLLQNPREPLLLAKALRPERLCALVLAPILNRRRPEGMRPEPKNPEDTEPGLAAHTHLVTLFGSSQWPRLLLFERKGMTLRSLTSYYCLIKWNGYPSVPSRKLIRRSRR